MVRRQILIGLVLFSSMAGYAIDNGDFTDGLAFWKAAANVSESSGEAVLSDQGANHSFLFQATAFQAGIYTIEFDFLNGLSATVPPGAFNDSFYASLYFVNTLSDFILENDKFDATRGLMDLDANGAFNVNGVVGASTKGASWSHFSGTFTNSHSYALAVFELYDLNETSSDSAVRVDNVRITSASP